MDELTRYWNKDLKCNMELPTFWIAYYFGIAFVFLMAFVHCFNMLKARFFATEVKEHPYNAGGSLSYCFFIVFLL